VPTALAGRRLEVLAAARADPGGFVRLEPGALRFSLGTSLADVAVPVQVTGDARAIASTAAVELALLLCSHHRGFVPADELDRLILREDYASLPPVPRLLGAGEGGPDLRTAAQLGPAVHPALTGGLVGAWMGKGGRGRSLVALWIEVLRQAFAERAEARGVEETPLLAALALSTITASFDDEVRAALPGPPLERYFRAAVLGGMWLAARTGLARVWRDEAQAQLGRELPSGPASSADHPLLLRLEAVLSPTAFLGSRATTLQGGVTLYGLELSAGLPGADELVARLAAGAPPAEAERALVAALAEEDLGRRAAQAVAAARLRELLAAGLAEAEAAGAGDRPALEPLRLAFSGPGALASSVADEASRKAFLRALRAATPPGSEGSLARAAAAVARWKRADPGLALGIAGPAALAEYAATAVALVADLAVERMVVPARRALSFRSGREAEGGAEAEWEGGRLYRIDSRPGPILRPREERRAGHLFADVKDFTRRTGLLGQAAMADFLRREFYGPILAAAQEHFGGMGHLADRGGVTLNNLLGDAVSFTGRVEEMVLLAKAIRSQLAAYGHRLSRQLSSEAVAGQLAALEESHAGALGHARAERAQAEAALAAEPPGRARHAAAQARVRALRAEEARLADERARALARARGEALEAGIFVSHGPEPVVVVIEDDVFGRNRVAIADRINESARGTARAAAARARADAALERERARRGDPAVAHAWSVFIGQPLLLSVPVEVEDAALRHWRAGELVQAMKLLSGPVREGLAAAARQDGDRPGDVYNSGAALSEEALEAFLGAVSRTREVRRVTVEPADVPEALRARWFFGEGPLELVACFLGDRVLELFRRVGRAAFRGMGTVVIWELAADDGGPAALASALGEGWLRAAAAR
jgi:hypothetical protein